MSQPTILDGYQLQFTAPSGFNYTIREQNGADDDILSNPSEAKSLMNISRFIAGIVVDTDYTPNGKLTTEIAHHLPTLDRYAILFRSRIHSLGKTLFFTHDWGKENGGEATYEQDLEEFLFDYSQQPSLEELEAKPDAIPYYPHGKVVKDIPITLDSGKELLFDLMTGAAEAQLVNLPLDKITRNQELISRNLRLKEGEAYRPVKSFQAFSPREMLQIRQVVASYDPVFKGTTTIENPYMDGQSTKVALMGIPGFFFLGEI